MTKTELGTLLDKCITRLGLYDKKPDNWSEADFEDVADDLLADMVRLNELRGIKKVTWPVIK